MAKPPVAKWIAVRNTETKSNNTRSGIMDTIHAVINNRGGILSRPIKYAAATGTSGFVIIVAMLFLL